MPQIDKMKKAIVESKVIENAKAIETRIKDKVFDDLSYIFQENWIQSRDVKNLIHCVIDSTIVKLSEESEK